jgi:hypothetical protein
MIHIFLLYNSFRRFSICNNIDDFNEVEDEEEVLFDDDDTMRTLIPILTMLIHNTTTSWQFSIDYII